MSAWLMLHGTVLRACIAWDCRSDTAAWPNLWNLNQLHLLLGIPELMPSGRQALPVRALQLKEALLEHEFLVCSLWTQLFLCNMTLYGWLCMFNVQSCWESRRYIEACVLWWIFHCRSILIKVLCLVLCSNSDLVRMSPYALEVYKNTRNIKIRTGSPSPSPPKRVLGVEQPPSIVPYAIGSQVCSDMIASCWSGAWGPSFPLVLCFVGRRNSLDLFNDKRRSWGSLPFVLSLPTIVFISACLQYHCFCQCNRVACII